MSSYIPADLRRLVEIRAGGLCEYCLIHQEDTFFGFEIDHIVSEKHGGPTEAANLALACLTCNRRKGTDIGSIASGSRQLHRFFHPRLDRWADHFELIGAEIHPRTLIGEVTARIFGFNDEERWIERNALVGAGRYPPPAAGDRVI